MEMIEPARQYEMDLTSYSPPSPQTPPMNPPSSYQDSHRTNTPLFDLIESEQKYVEDLKCLLQKVTASWSRDNLPPPELDLMFRNVEMIYRQNKKFYSKLNKIGSDPVSLGDTLMVWIDDMDKSYTKYIEAFKSGFDSIPEIEENLNLQQTLSDISAEKNQPVSLDYFFDMPLKRLHYYKKLYMRLYRGTEPGRSDNSLLLAANERIDCLLEKEKEVKISNRIKEIVMTPPVVEVISSSVVKEVASSPVAKNVVSSAVISPFAEEVYSVIISPTIEVHYADEDYEKDIATKSTSIKSQTISSPIHSNTAVSTDEAQSIKRNWSLEELESQLDTSKTKDLFTKLQKVVKVSLLSTDLPFKREIVLHNDFIVETTKFMNSTETHHINVHIFLLTDLLLICQQITQEEKQEFFLEKDLRLLFPPLNVEHLAINDVSDDEEDILELTILQKEALILYANNKGVKSDWLREIAKAIESSNAIAKPQDSQTMGKVESNPVSTPSTQSTSAKELKRSPTVGNLINKEVNSLRPVSSVSQSSSIDNLTNKEVNSIRPVSSVSQSSSLFPGFSSTDLPIRSRTPDPPQNAGGKYPGDYLPTGQGIGQDRHSDPLLSPDINRLNTGLHYGRSNSMTSIVSVTSIASFKETTFRSSACKVFIWTNGEWQPLTKKDEFIVEVRLTAQNKGNWAILLESSNKMVLNAWVHPTTTLHRDDANSVSISCEIRQKTEYYKITTKDSAESDQFLNSLLNIKESANQLDVPTDKYVSRSSSLLKIEPLREVEQTVTQIMETKCRVFLQNDHGVWTNIGWGNMKLLLETPSHRKRIIVNSDKKTAKTIIDSIIFEDGVERIGKSVALTLNNMGSSLRIVYLLKMKNEASAIKVFDVMREKRKR